MSKFRIGSRACRRVVVAAFIAGAVSVLPAAPAAASELGCTREADWAEMDREWAAEVRDLTNDYRATLGLGRLEISDSLTKAAEWKAAHMANYGYFSHDDQAPPVDRSWDERVEDCGYHYGMGENIAYGYRSPLAVVQGWIGSSGHRLNIEDPSYSVIGVGAALDGDGTTYWVQIFGTHDDGEAPAPDEEEPAATDVKEPSAAAAEQDAGADETWANGSNDEGAEDVGGRDYFAGWPRHTGIPRWYRAWSTLL